MLVGVRLDTYICRFVGCLDPLGRYTCFSTTLALSLPLSLSFFFPDPYILYMYNYNMVQALHLDLCTMQSHPGANAYQYVKSQIPADVKVSGALAAARTPFPHPAAHPQPEARQRLEPYIQPSVSDTLRGSCKLYTHVHYIYVHLYTHVQCTCVYMYTNIYRYMYIHICACTYTYVTYKYYVFGSFCDDLIHTCRYSSIRKHF